MLREDKDREKATKIFELYDADTRELLFEGEYRAIKEFPLISKGKSQFNGWYCGFGALHDMKFQCDCQAKYKVTEAAFREKAREIYGKKIITTKIIGAQEVQRVEWNTMYMQDLKYAERNNIVELCR